jgi:hypothetical protein
MGHYDRYQDRSIKRRETSPIWRGIGCILLVVLPLITYALTSIAVPFVITTKYVPQELQGYAKFPAWISRVPVLNGIAGFLGIINDLWLKITIFIVILVLLTGSFSLVYVAILQVIGPPRYGTIDAPPSKHKAKQYKR